MEARSNKCMNSDSNTGYSVSKACSLIEKELVETQYGCVLDLIYHTAREVPLNIAISDQNGSITYAEMIIHLERMASLLMDYGIMSGDIIAVHGKKSISLFITFLAVLKVGAILMPVSEDLPEMRKHMMVEQAKANWAIHFENEHSDYFKNCQNILFLGRTGILHEENETFLRHKNYSTISIRKSFPTIDVNSPAYIFFTSGSTLQPKGIKGVHKAITQFVIWEKHAFKLDKSLKVLQLASISFDAVLRDLFLPLIVGGELFIPKTEYIQDPSNLMKQLEKEKITLIHTIPSIVENWLTLDVALSLKFLQYLILSGEPLLGSLILKWRQKFPDCKAKIVNFYGPTETTMIKTFFMVPDEIPLNSISCGNPISDTEIYVFDIHDKILPPNEKGEIIIRTPFKTLGYISNHQQENIDKFFVNPYRQDLNDILYRTGDLGYITEEGLVFIDGRKDDELKINGIRINPLEITAVLSLNPKIAACLVLPSKNEEGENLLIAAIVLKSNEKMPPEYFRKYLIDKLPLAMIPHIFEFVENFPLLNNGKVDKTTLIKQLGKIRKERDIENKVNLNIEGFTCNTISNNIVSAVLTVWNELLGNADTNIKSNFFELGGNSIKAMLLWTKLRQIYPVELSLREVLENSTVEKIAAIIKEKLELESVDTLEQKGSKELRNWNHSKYQINEIAAKESLKMNNLTGSKDQFSKIKEEKMNSESWIHVFSRNSTAKLRLICFHYSGGNAYVFNDFAKLFPSSIELYSIQLPGRMNLLDISPYQKIEDLLPPLAEQMLPCLTEKPFVFWGHSLGGLIGYCLTHFLKENYALQPEAIVVSACTAPSLRDGGEMMHKMPQNEFIEKLLSYNKDHNEIPVNLLENADLINFMLPILRADFSLAETYQHVYREPLDCPIIAYVANNDPQVSIDEVKAWKQETSKQFTLKTFEGGHFFIKTHQTQFVKTLTTDLNDLLSVYS